MVTTLVRDNEDLIEPFLEYYLRLGVDRIVLLDNGSRDATIPRALRYDPATVLRCTLPFDRYEPEMKRFLIERYGDGCWSLVVDVDEFFDYPGSDELTFSQFLGYLDQRRYTAVVGTLLDMFADGPPENWPPLGRDSIRACVWYDLSGFYPGRYDWLKRLNRFADPAMLLWEGGIRWQVLGRRTLVNKFPLIKYRRGGGLRLRSLEHHAEGAEVADVSVLLRHYKFDRDFLKRWRAAAESGRHAVHVKDHQAAARWLEENPYPVLRGPTARRLVHINQLVAEGFLRASPAYWDYVRACRAGKSGAGDQSRRTV